jgi:hypothetical protein
MLPLRLLFLAAAPALLLPGGVRAASTADTTKAAERCEAEVSDTIRRMRGRDAKEVQFVAAKRALQPATEDETSVRGEGRYSAAAGGTGMPFTYTCAYNAKTDATSGVLFRETGTVRAAPEKAFEPDLTNISPEACESAAAAELKDKHPRVGRITFGSDSRRMQPGTNGQVQLIGQGAVERAPGMNAIPFSYRCQVDPRNGRIAGISTSD